MKKNDFDRLVAIYREVLSAIGGFFFLAFCVCVMVQVIARNFLSSAPSWTEEAARYTFIYMVAFGCGVAILKDEFVNVEFLHDSLEARGLHKVNKAIDILIKMAMLLLSGFILFRAVPTFAFIKFRMVSTAMQIPMQYIYFSQVLLYGFVCISLVIRLYQLFRDFNKPETKEEQESGMERQVNEAKEEMGS